MLRYRQMKTLQKFNSVRAAIHKQFNPDRRLIGRDDVNARRSTA